MKKRNWLMTIAFAVLSLTIVSTMVIGSTYAKFVSQVAGKGSAQAAGFLVAGTAADFTAEGVMAPGEYFDTTIGMSYFSQVNTQITNVAASDFVGTGVFTSENWTKLVAYYNANWKKIGAAFGYGTYNSTGDELTANNPAIGGAGPVSSTLAVTNVITTAGTSGESFVTTFIKAIMAAGNRASFQTGNGTSEAAAAVYALASTASSPADIIPAMLPNASAKLTANLVVRTSWVTPKIDSSDTNCDLFDTFLGACITAYATATELSLAYLDNGVAATPLAVIVTTGAAGNQLTVPGSATTSTVGLSVGLKAEQYTGTTNAATDTIGYAAVTV